MMISGQEYVFTSSSMQGVRKDNQDSLGHYISDDGGFFVALVCDGMGGLADGALASSSIVDGLLAWAPSADTSSPEAFCSGFVEELSVLEEKLRQEHPGSGTTVSAAVCLGGIWFSLHVGDSRCYTEKDGTFFRTIDQSPVDKMLQAGLIDEDEALTHPMSNIVSKFIGGGFAKDAEIQTLPEWDVLVLCSDGAFGYMPCDEFRGYMTELDAEGICRKALELGSKDNVSVISIRRS